MTENEKRRTRIKKDLKDFLEHRQWYKENERENAEVCEKFLWPVDEKYEAYNERHENHGSKVEREY